MSKAKKHKKHKSTEGAAPAADAGTASDAATLADAAPVKTTSVRVRQALAVVKRHPLGVVAGVAAAVALVEIELAVGLVTGIGATALLATKSGPEARQEVRALSQEVLNKGKAALERARGAIAARSKAREAEPEAAAPAPAVAAAPNAGEPAAS